MKPALKIRDRIWFDLGWGLEQGTISRLDVGKFRVWVSRTSSVVFYLSEEGWIWSRNEAEAKVASSLLALGTDLRTVRETLRKV